MRTDRELLELAAKAAGYKVAWEGGGTTGWMAGGTWWNPLTDDGDALRLAVKLEMDVFIRGGRWTEAVCPMSKPQKVLHDTDPCAATRCAITLAAAAVGEAKP